MRRERRASTLFDDRIARVMARGSTKKHSKQAGTLGSEALTHAERRALGYGTVRERLGRETVKDFDACALTLSTTDDGVCTPRGVVYDRGAIVQCLVDQRREFERKARAHARAKEAEARADDARDAKRRRVELAAFHAANHGGGGTTDEVEGEGKAYAGAASRQAMEVNATRAATMDGFWRVDGGVDDGLTRAKEKPEKETKCPTTLERLRMKDLVTIKWTKVREGESGKYMCPITYKTFTNATAIVVLKPTGTAISEEGFKRVVEKEGAYDGVKIRPDKDVIKLQKGGTGFAASGTQVESKANFDMGLAGGAELRGQSRGGQSKFGLRFN